MVYDMDSTIRAIRAISALLFQRIFRIIAIVVAIIVALIWLAIIVLAIKVSGWWLMTLIIVAPLTLIIAAIGLALWALSNRLLPRKLTGQERSTVYGFTDKIMQIAETRATPVPVLAFLIAKDVVRGKGSSYVSNLVSDTTSLKGDFAEIRRMFETKTLI